MLLVFQGFLLLVIGHAEHPHPGLKHLVSFREDTEP
jgi:hypothetical protein